MSDNRINDDLKYLPNRFGFYIRNVKAKKSVKSEIEAKHESQQRIYDVMDDFLSELHDFKDIMLSLLGYAKQVGAVAYNTRNAQFIELYNALRAIVEAPRQNKKPLYELCIYFRKDVNGEDIEQVFPIYDPDKARTIRELEDIDDSAPQILCETVLQQIVNRWEAHLTNLVKIQYSSNPNLLTNKIEVTYDQLLGAKERGGFSRLFIDKIAAEALDGGIEDHLRFFREDKEFSFDFGKYFSEFRALKEIMYHRDVVVHCDGIASEQHCKKMLGICPKSEVPRQGSRVPTDFKYLMHSWDIVFAAGCIMSHIVGKRFAETRKIQGMMDAPDSIFVNISFEAMREGRYYAAQLMLEYALNISKHDDGESVLALKVNLAIAYKHIGQEKKFRAIVNSRDWDSRNDKFKVVIYALRGDYKEVYRLLKGICKQEPDYMNNVYEWIAFEGLRKDTMFEKEMSKIKAYKSFVPSRGKRAILDFNAKPADVRGCVAALFRSVIPDGCSGSEESPIGRRQQDTDSM